jgi:hypothetical protein
MVYLVKDNNKVRVFYSEAEMKEAGFNKAGLTVSKEVFNSNGCYARIIGGKIVVGRTEAEIAEDEKQAQIAEYKAQLDEIDMEAGASRVVRDAVIAVANIRILLDITDQKISSETDPAKKAAMQALKGLNPETHQGLEKFTVMEAQAAPIRTQLSPLLNS